MEQKPYPAFGYVIVRNKVKAGEIFNDEMLKDSIFTVENASPNLTGSISGSEGHYVWTLLSGVHSYTNLETGDVEFHYKGWCNLVNPMQTGIFKFSIVEDGEYICFSPRANKDRSPVMPELEHFEMNDGESKEIKQGTKLYLLDGSLQIGEITMPPMRQIRFKTSDQNVTAIGNCLGYIFKD
jgi:hypothetical protein